MRRPLLLALALLAACQSKPAGAGHWEGTLQSPKGELRIAVDLAHNDKGEWIGSFDLPDRRIDGAPLFNILVKRTSVSFAIQPNPGAPGFQGRLSADSKELSGDLATPGGGSLPTVLKWVSEPKVKLLPKGTHITKEMEGTWEGKLTAPNGKELRLRVRLANGLDGATGTLDSLDQGGQMRLGAITQNGARLRFELRIVSAAFEGQLKDGALVGEWRQVGRTLPLTLKKAAAKEKK